MITKEAMTNHRQQCRSVLEDRYLVFGCNLRNWTLSRFDPTLARSQLKQKVTFTHNKVELFILALLLQLSEHYQGYMVSPW